MLLFLLPRGFFLGAFRRGGIESFQYWKGSLWWQPWPCVLPLQPHAWHSRLLASSGRYEGPCRIDDCSLFPQSAAPLFQGSPSRLAFFPPCLFGFRPVTFPSKFFFAVLSVQLVPDGIVRSFLIPCFRSGCSRQDSCVLCFDPFTGITFSRPALVPLFWMKLGVFK